LPVAGSQAAVQALPQLRAPCRIGVLSPGYAEHAHAWRRAGHKLLMLAVDNIGREICNLDVLVLIHPNNPTGVCFAVEQLLDWRAKLAARGGWLVVDEAFMDATPEQSLISYSDRPGLIVLRSLGKFFGLAGMRVGFVAAEPELLARLRERLGPWSVAGPSRHVAGQALADRPWQERTRFSLDTSAQNLRRLLRIHGLEPNGGGALFQWVRTPAAIAIRDGLARQGILVRLFEHPASLRFGLPGNEVQLRRLGAALTVLRERGVMP
jgi:L-threonine-O-3-phosphate decarboxylase